MNGRRSRNDEGVSTVIGAVLVFALVISVFAVYLAAIVPTQVSNAEAARMKRFSTSMGDLAVQVDQAASRPGGGAFTSQLELGGTSLSFFKAYQSGGSLLTQRAAVNLNVHCAAAKILTRDGVADPASTFATMGGPTLEARSLQTLGLRVSSYRFSGGVNQSATLTATSNSNTLGSFTMILWGSNQAVLVRTSDALGRTLVERVVTSQAGPVLNAFNLNVLDPQYGFSALLADATDTVKLTSADGTGATGWFVVYTGKDGALAVVGVGRDVGATFTRSVLSDALVYQSSNRRFLDQTYALEGGAVVVAQSNGEFLTSPPFQLNRTGTQQVVTTRLLNLTASGSASGAQKAVLAAVVEKGTRSLVSCTSPTFLVTSQHSAGWLNAWQAALRGAGLSAGAAVDSGGFLTVTPPGDWILDLSEARATVQVA